MKKLLLTALLSSTLSAQFIHKDKVNHIGLGLAAYGGCILIGELKDSINIKILRDIILDSKTCVLAPIGVGIAKEAYDATGRGNVEWDDFTSTIAVPLMISYTIEF